MNLEALPIERLCGLRPQVWLSVGTGFVREDVKTLALSRCKGFLKEAITDLTQLCLDLTRIPSEQVISFSARQEALKSLLAEPRIIAQLPELNKIRRQKNFLPKFDHALQSGRLAFAHAVEEEVYEERLREKVGESLLRQELRGFSQAYEIWLRAAQCTDLPLLLKQAIEILENGWPAHLTRPTEIWVLSVESPESLEREFWDRLRQYVEVKQVKSLVTAPQVEAPVSWQRWHTLDDAAEALGEEIVSTLEKDPTHDWRSYAVLIPDLPAVRRSLHRVITDKNIPLVDPRDPTQLRWEESVKLALLPLDVVGGRFERSRVIAFLGSGRDSLLAKWVQEINSRAIRTGLNSYAGSTLADVYAQLEKLNQVFGGKRTCQSLAENHLAWLKENRKSPWVISLFASIWQTLIADLTRVGLHEKKAQLPIWLEKLKSRLWDAAPPPTPQKPAQGLQIYRLQQAPILLRDSLKKLWIFGLPPQWLAEGGIGDYWFTIREREVLAAEFAVRAGPQIREERLEILKTWLVNSKNTVVLDARFSPDGREKPSVLPILKELGSSLGRRVPAQPTECGGHARFLSSYEAVRPVPAQELKLPALTASALGIKPEITATALDRYSRCSFQALAYHRWNLKDLREPERDLWPDVRGTILHEAVKLLVRSSRAMGGEPGTKKDFSEAEGSFFSLSPREALELAWQARPPRGLFRSVRIESYVKLKLVKILEKFCEKERSYLEKSGVVPVSLDDRTVRLRFPEFSIVGQPDRIDRHPEGLFILDYKSSGTTPHGSEMMEEGYRLQLAFYVLAIMNSSPERVIGAQWVELTRKGTRNSGIFFKAYNGKADGNLTDVQTRSKSLMASESDEVWNTLAQHVLNDATAFVHGEFAARPKTAQKDKECNSCRIGDLCGVKRCLS